MDLHGTKPVIDKVFPMAEAQAAYEHLIAGRHFGKVCISIP
jgi:NADPH:quinone reductase-like Zn-dependent oxidoreductase